MNILYLINSLPNLQALIVHSQDDYDGGYYSSLVVEPQVG
jgi:hypothetical protein